MKTGNFILMMIMIGGLLLTSCTKDDDTTPENPVAGNGTMSLTVDGSSWTASLSVQGVNTNGVVNVTGSDSNAHQASVILMGVTEPGTYQVSTGSQHQLRWTEGLGQDQTFVANGILGSGTITVTEISSTKVVGTFSFTGFSTASSSKEITNGQFSATF